MDRPDNRPNGGVGSNQYQTRGSSRQSDTGPTPPKLKSDGLGGVPEEQNDDVYSPERIRRLKHDLDKEMSVDPDRWIRWSLADTHQTPPDILVKLVADLDPSVRQAASSNPHMPAQVLEKLASHEDLHIRTGVAMNLSSPPEALNHLAQDTTERVRLAVVRNVSTPSSAIGQLMHDMDHYISTTAEIVRAHRSLK